MSSSSQGSFVGGEVHEPAETADLMQDFRGTAYCVGDDRHSDRQHPPERGGRSHCACAAPPAGRASSCDAPRPAAPAPRALAESQSHSQAQSHDVGDRDGMDVLTR